jgi:hypothetical protein
MITSEFRMGVTLTSRTRKYEASLIAYSSNAFKKASREIPD